MIYYLFSSLFHVVFLFLFFAIFLFLKLYFISFITFGILYHNVLPILNSIDPLSMCIANGEMSLESIRQNYFAHVIVAHRPHTQTRIYEKLIHTIIRNTFMRH